MKHFVLLAVVTLVLCGTGPGSARAEEPNDTVEPVGPTTLEQLEKELRAESERLERLLQLCRKDKRFRLVETYRAYTIQDFSNPRRKVKALTLLEIVADPGAPLDLRKEAKKLLESKQAKSFDPDLQRTRGNKKPRNEFFRKHVAKLLNNTKSVQTRIFAHQLLLSYFPGYKNDSPVLNYDPVKGTRTEWKKARTHWERVLR